MEESKIAELIKTAREAKGFTQQEVADKINMGLRNYQHIEAGRFPKYKTESVKDIETILEISIYDKLYPVSRMLSLIANEEPATTYLTKRRDSKLKASPFLVPFVSRKAQAGYAKNYDHVDYIDTLERYSLPPGVDPRGAEWMYFEIEGSSMEPSFVSGDIILASMVPQVDWQEIRNFYVYVIICENSLQIKRLYRKSDTKWVMISDNEKDYPQTLLDVADIRQLWVYRKTWHTNAKPPKKFEIKI